MMGTTALDETFCGTLCQHPSCWVSQRRIIRGIPHQHHIPDDDTDSEDEGLPTQKVLNLLDDFGPDPRDRYPSEHAGRPKHIRSTSTRPPVRGQSRESFPRTRAPRATPASGGFHSAVQSVGITSAGVTRKPHPPKPSMVEVQEVFDLDDLQSDWHETFKPRKYYVWVPKDGRKPQEDTNENAPLSQFGPGVLPTKNLTEEMVPQEIEWEREARTMRRARPRGRRSPLFSPYLSPPTTSCMDRSSMNEPRGQPTNRSQGYQGLYELLDLPRDVLTQMMKHITERDLLDEQRFTEALLRTLPKLEKENTTVSLAYGNVLQQRKMNLHEGLMKNRKSLEPFTNPQVFVLDDEYRRSAHQAHERSMNLSQQPSHLEAPHPTPLGSGQITPRPAQPAQPTPRTLNNKEPLPAIQVHGEEEQHDPDRQAISDDFDPLRGKDKKSKVPAITLGLPEIPSGTKHTRPFHYKGLQFDFTLAAVETPPPPPSEAALDDRGISPLPSDRASTIHVTMPTVHDPQTAQHTSAGVSFADGQQTPYGHRPLDEDAVRFSPLNPPKDGSLYRSNTLDSAGGARPPQNTPITPGLPGNMTPEATAILDPIPEADADTNGGGTQRTNSQQMSRTKSRGYIHEVPPQPPSSPDMSERSVPSRATGAASVAVNVSETPVPGQRDVPSRQQAGPSPQYLQNGNQASPGLTPEPWPQVDEESYKVDPTPPPRKTPQTRSTIHDIEIPQSSVDYDDEEHDSQTALAAMLPRSASPKKDPHAQMNSAEKMRKIWDEGGMETESPGPPPPSPELRMAPTENSPTLMHPLVQPVPTPTRGTSGLGMLPEEGHEETQSDITISAKPPSNLDETSRLNTPAGLVAPRGAISREPTNMEPLAETTSEEALTGRSDPAGSGGLVPEPQVHVRSAPPETELLDQFDATDDQFKAELEKEYEKLSDDPKPE